MVTKYQIRSPIWNGGQPAVGLAEWKMLHDEILEIRVTHRRKKNGKLTFPGVYRTTKSHALTCPVDPKCEVKLRVVPLADCDWREGSFNENEQGVML